MDDRSIDEFLRFSSYAAATGVLLSLVSLWLVPGWVGATLAVGQGALWTFVMLHRQPSPWIANLVLFGLVAGFVELLADVWLVRELETLHYPVGGPFVLDSPLYMPFAWWGMLSGGMALGVALRRKLSLARASLLVALALGLYIPLFELIALHAQWWHYSHPVLLLGAVPPPIVLGEILLALPLVAVSERLRHEGPWGACGLGVAIGLWIAASYRIAWALVG